MTALAVPYSAATALQQERSILNEPVARFWSDEELNNWTIEACVDISTKTLCREVIDTVVLVTNTMNYTAMVTGSAGSVAKIVKVHACLYGKSDGSSDYKSLRRIRPIQVNRQEKIAGPPEVFFHFNTVLGLYPLATSDENGDIVQVYHSSIASAITELPEYYQPFAVNYAIGKALWKDKQWASGGLLLNDYYSMIQFHRADLHDPPATAISDLKQPDVTQTVGG